MPKKSKYTKEDFINAALKITREDSIYAVTARSIGTMLECSTRPLFTFFDSVEELKEEVYKISLELFEEYLKSIKYTDNSLYTVGLAMFEFSKKEPSLYSFMASYGKGTLEVYNIVSKVFGSAVSENCKIPPDTAHTVLFYMFLSTNSLISIFVENETFCEENVKLHLKGLNNSILNSLLEESTNRRNRRSSFESWID